MARNPPAVTAEASSTDSRDTSHPSRHLRRTYDLGVKTTLMGKNQFVRDDTDEVRGYEYGKVHEVFQQRNVFFLNKEDILSKYIRQILSQLMKGACM
jgi:hypothetical protein